MAASKEPELDARDRILRAASELFYRDGIWASGVDTLIDRAKVAKATFYRHFPSKDDLVLTWLRGPEARWLDSLASELDRRAEPPLQRLVAFWEVLGDWVQRHEFIGCPYLNALVEIRDPNTPARREIESFVQEIEDYFHRTAAAARLENPGELARRLRYIAMGMFMGIRVERSRAPIGTARTSAIEVLAVWMKTTPEEVERRVAGM